MKFERKEHHECIDGRKKDRSGRNIIIWFGVFSLLCIFYYLARLIPRGPRSSNLLNISSRSKISKIPLQLPMWLQTRHALSSYRASAHMTTATGITVTWPKDALSKIISNHIPFISFSSRFPSPFLFPLFSLISNSFPSRGIAKGNEREYRPEGNDLGNSVVKRNRWNAEVNENPFTPEGKLLGLV